MQHPPFVGGSLWKSLPYYTIYTVWFCGRMAGREAAAILLLQLRPLIPCRLGLTKDKAGEAV